MSQNDLILLNQMLEQRMTEAGAGLSASDYFEIFSAEQVLKDEDLSYDEIESGIVDNAGDGGIDSFYLFINGTLYSEDLDLNAFKKNIDLVVFIIQSKTSSGFSEGGMDHFVSATRDMFDLNISLSSLKKVYHKDLLNRVHEFRETYKALAGKFPQVSFRYAYVAKAVEVHPNVERKVKSLQETLERAISPVVFSFEFVTASRLLALARKAPSVTYRLPLAENPISTGQEGFICLVALKDFFTFVRDDSGYIRTQLFEGNVRDYQGNTEVNREIRATLEKQSEEDFWWLNNGISMLCSNASLTGKTLTIEDPEIVNGLQTSREIFEVLSRTDPAAETRNLLVRVLKPHDEISRDRIIKATNSQTAIPPASLRATDKIHRDIEEFLSLKGLYYDRRKNHYKNSGKPVKKIIGIPFMAQAVIACALLEPANARARPSTLVKDDEAYRRIFNLSYPLDLYYKCAAIARATEHVLKGSTVPDVYREHANNLRFYVATLVTLRLSGVPRPSVPNVAAVNLQKMTDGYIESASEAVYKEYKALGGTDQVAKGIELEKRILEQHKKATLKELKKGTGK
ncbi:MAG: AIPR family protein [Nitrospirota bacterium]